MRDPVPEKNKIARGALKKLYQRYLGELARIEAPPKSMNRKWRGRDEYLEAAPARAARADQIREALPHLAYVIRIFDPTWDPLTAKPIQPSRRHDDRPRPSIGWSRAALMVLREADEPLTIAEIVSVICDRYDIDISTVEESQRCHTAVNNPLMATYKHQLVANGGQPARWSLKR